MATTSGGCLCGEIRIEISAPPVRAGVCHCLDCRKHHGAIFSSFAIYPADALTVTGEPRVYVDGRGDGRYFCGRCGSPLFVRYEDNPFVEIFAGIFDAPDATPPPSYELWTVRREGWLPPFSVVSHEKDRP